MREINNIVDFESFKSAINKLDKMVKTEPSKIDINFPKDQNRAKDFFDKFFEIADGNPEWND